MKKFSAFILIICSVLSSKAGTFSCAGKGESIALKLVIETNNPLTGPATKVTGSLKFLPELTADKTNELIDAEFNLDNLKFLGYDEESGQLQFGLEWQSTISSDYPRKLIYSLQFGADATPESPQTKYKGRTVFLKFLNSDEVLPENRFLVPTTKCTFKP